MRAAVVHDVRFEYERIFRDLEGVADDVVWTRASTLCRPREGREKSPPPARAPLVERAPAPASATSASADWRASTVLSAEQAEAERLEVEQELAFIRRAMNERLAYLTTQLGEPDEQPGEPDEQPGEA